MGTTTKAPTALGVMAFLALTACTWLAIVQRQIHARLGDMTTKSEPWPEVDGRIMWRSGDRLEKLLALVAVPLFATAQFAAAMAPIVVSVCFLVENGRSFGYDEPSSQLAVIMTVCATLPGFVSLAYWVRLLRSA